MRTALTWLLALLVLPTSQGCGQQSKANQPEPPVVTLPEGIPGRPAGPVLDQADILKPTDEAALDRHLRDYFHSSGNALVVVSVVSLSGQSIDPFATTLFNSWGIGDEQTSRGLLILVAPNERKVRIEVGCGLEAAITNEIAGQIIQQNIIPLFKNGDLQGGTLAGVRALEDKLAMTTARGPTSPGCRKIMEQAA